MEVVTNGMVKVEVYPGGSLASSKEQYDAVLGGVSDLTHWNPNYLAGRWPMYEVFNQPFLWPSSTVASLAMKDMYFANQSFFDSIFEDTEIITFYATTPQSITFKDKKVTTLEELAGMRIRAPGKTEVDIIDVFGATPVQLASSEVYTSLERGVLEGVIYATASIPSIGFWEVADYIMELGISSSGMGVWMNKESFAKVPDEYKAILKHLGWQLGLQVGVNYDVFEQGAREWLKEKGLEIYSLSPEEQANWEKAAEPVTETWITDKEAEGQPAREMLTELREIIAQRTSIGQ